jgi:hypothetical protein
MCHERFKKSAHNGSHQPSINMERRLAGGHGGSWTVSPLFALRLAPNIRCAAIILALGGLGTTANRMDTDVQRWASCGQEMLAETSHSWQVQCPRAPRNEMKSSLTQAASPAQASRGAIAINNGSK